MILETATLVCYNVNLITSIRIKTGHPRVREMTMTFFGENEIRRLDVYTIADLC